MSAPSWESVIGLEVHVQLKTRSKIFSGATTAYGAPPNTQACAVDLALPGVLPVLNAQAVRMAVVFGLAVDGRIAERCRFDRKSYFYPDLPKGYQISQLDEPIVSGGHLDIDMANGTTKRVCLTRAHLEEDAGKSLHEDYAGQTGIDLNRAGTPLLEVVSEPELATPEEAGRYFRTMHTLVRTLGICDGNLNEGSMRCDANVSVRRRGETALGQRTEIKNLNSFRFLEAALRFEIDRQIEVLESGREVVRETLLYDHERHETRSMRGKELSEDYRYFPDPDLLPVVVTPAMVDAARAALPELPAARRQRYMAGLGLPDYDAAWLADEPDAAAYFDAATAACGEPKKAANWIMGDVAAAARREDTAWSDIPVPADQLGRLIARIEDGSISGKIAKSLFRSLWDDGGAGRTVDVDATIESRGLKQVSDAGELATIVNDVLANHPEQVEQVRAGKTRVLGFLVGQVMKASGGQANPRRVNELLREAIDQRGSASDGQDMQP